jgi:hypothetical protein
VHGMATQDTPNIRSSSTTWAWQKVIVRGRPAPEGTVSARGRRIASLRSRDPRKPITIQLHWRGGPEATWRVRARDTDWVFPGHMCVQDMMDIINRTRGRNDES